MSNSSLVSYTKLSPNYNPRTEKISKITIHHMAVVNGSLSGVGNHFAKPSTAASSNYAIDSQGKVAMYVEEHNRAWTSSSAYNDQRAITIEVANSTGDPEWRVSDKAYETLIALCVDICRRNDIKELVYTGDKYGSLTRHNMFAATGCPGPYLQSKFPDIVERVNAQLGSSKKITVELAELKVNSQGEQVKTLQRLLTALGTYTDVSDGGFGPKTKAGVIAFQKNMELPQTGIVDEDTWNCLLKGEKSFKPYQVEVIAPDGLNVRSGPSTSYKVITALPKGTKKTIVEEQDGWGKLSDINGWVSLAYTKKL